MAFEPRIVRPDDFAPPEEIVSAGCASGGHAADCRVSRAGAADGSVRSEAEDGWLPDDLQELATQLSADAARLTDCDPVDQGAEDDLEAADVDAPHDRGRARNWRLRVTAAAVLVGVGLWLAGREERPAARSGEPPRSIAESPAVEPSDRLARKEPTLESRSDPSLIWAVAEQAGERQPIRITFDGDAVSSVARQSPPSDSAPQVHARVVGRNPFDVRSGSSAHIAELSAGGNATPPRAPRDELGMLQAQLQAFERVIIKLQAEVRRRDQLLEETTDLVKSLTAEVELLRKQQGAGK